MGKRDKRTDVERELPFSDVEASYELVRAQLGSLCPCRNGWKRFEQHVNIVSQLTRDRSPEVRAHALHILQDALLLQSIGDAEYRFQSVEEVLRKRRSRLSRQKDDKVEVKAQWSI